MARNAFKIPQGIYMAIRSTTNRLQIIYKPYLATPTADGNGESFVLADEYDAADTGTGGAAAIGTGKSTFKSPSRGDGVLNVDAVVG
jgi:hypothetical protein